MDLTKEGTGKMTTTNASEPSGAASAAAEKKNGAADAMVIADGALIDPDKILLIDDPAHPLYDERATKKPSEELIADIKMNGILEPPAVYLNDDGKIACVYGRRRILAARELKKRDKDFNNFRIPVQFKKGDTKALIRMMLSENEHKEADDPVNRARKMKAFIDAGGTEAELRVACRCSEHTIKNVLMMLDAPKPIQKAVENKKIGDADGYKLAKLAKKDPEKATEALKELIEAHAAEALETTPKGRKAQRAKKRAARARTTSSGTASRSKKEMRDKLKELTESEVYKAKEQEVIVAVLKWCLGNDRAISQVCTKI